MANIHLCLVLLAAVLWCLILPIKEAVLNGTKLKTTVQWLVHSTSLPNSQRSHFVRSACSQLHLTTDFPSLPVGLFLGLPCRYSCFVGGRSQCMTVYWAWVQAKCCSFLQKSFQEVHAVLIYSIWRKKFCFSYDFPVGYFHGAFSSCYESRKSWTLEDDVLHVYAIPTQSTNSKYPKL